MLHLMTIQFRKKLILNMRRSANPWVFCVEQMEMSVRWKMIWIDFLFVEYESECGAEAVRHRTADGCGAR